MAIKAALLYQEAPVGVFLPNCEKTLSHAKYTESANRTAITSLIYIYFVHFPSFVCHVGKKRIVFLCESSLYLIAGAVADVCLTLRVQCLLRSILAWYQ